MTAIGSHSAQDAAHARPTKRPAYARQDAGESTRDDLRARRAAHEMRLVLEFDRALDAWLQGRGIDEVGQAVFVGDQGTGPNTRFVRRPQPEAMPVSMLPEPEHRPPPPAEDEPDTLLPALLHAAALHALRMAASASQADACPMVAPSTPDAAGGQAGGYHPGTAGSRDYLSALRAASRGLSA